MGATGAVRTINIGTAGGGNVQTIHIGDGAPANVITIGSTAGTASVTLRGKSVTQQRVVGTAFKATGDSPYAAVATDDFIGMDTTTGVAVVNLLPAVTGQRLMLSNTATNAVVNTATFNANGAEKFNTTTGVLGAAILTGAQFMTVVGKTGVGWFPVG